jgi:hypothetical protein
VIPRRVLPAPLRTRVGARVVRAWFPGDVVRVGARVVRAWFPGDVVGTTFVVISVVVTLGGGLRERPGVAACV